MKKYIALLRGVNVGGKNIISMPLLKTAFEKAEFYDVSTYINSGNIIFSSGSEDILELQQKCRQIILDAFQLDIAVAVLSADDLHKAINHAPTWWDSNAESKHNAIIVIAPASAESIIEAVGEAKPEYEQIAYCGQVIFWSAPLKTFSRTQWSKITASPAYAVITIRNANTTKKLAQLSQKE